jgi:hypothetical protein
MAIESKRVQRRAAQRISRWGGPPASKTRPIALYGPVAEWPRRDPRKVRDARSIRAGASAPKSWGQI